MSARLHKKGSNPADTGLPGCDSVSIGKHLSVGWSRLHTTILRNAEQVFIRWHGVTSLKNWFSSNTAVRTFDLRSNLYSRRTCRPTVPELLWVI